MPTRPTTANSIDVESAVRVRSRFQIHSSCRFWWTCQSGALHFGCGTTRNVSSGGVSISSTSAPKVGATVMVEIDLAWDGPWPDDDRLPNERVLRVEGRVVRHEQVSEDDHHLGFAVMATQATIEAAPPSPEGASFEGHYA